ncbi:hypothetical protein SAMN05216464_107188 [Mucilaginibacter pineti]|uniref:Uncharacterized protein n=1 Tax=Mucilaginibacter pineti TaxID=1391627 RepID=A0A1G7DZD5_9SPHI|nr:hypothetical protein [Mucilaginibacter pineti]SDE56455.1 hypothetical protein SAMN05216464_107188 [Mucilaginibacter pineti]
MKKTLAIIITILFHYVSYAQLRDTALAKRITINGFCLCSTTIADLRKSNPDLKETDVEEMDLSKNCFGEDQQFLAGKGYYTNAQPGIIFQKERDSAFISKIRLTREFKGKLPDGNFIDLKKFLLKDLFKLYPQFKDKWQSRDCSEYWKFSNDTISFYVKINKNKKPQFPIDKQFYLNKPIEGVDITISCGLIRARDAGYRDARYRDTWYNDAWYHDALYHDAEKHKDGVYYLDRIRVHKSDLQKINPTDIASLDVIKDSVITKRFGSNSTAGLFFIETKNFAKSRYQKYFSSKSPEYAKLITDPGIDAAIQYILNDKVLKENFEGDLAGINDKRFKGIKILTKAELISIYGISDKDYGVVISTDLTKK